MTSNVIIYEIIRKNKLNFIYKFKKYFSCELKFIDDKIICLYIFMKIFWVQISLIVNNLQSYELLVIIIITYNYHNVIRNCRPKMAFL